MTAANASIRIAALAHAATPASANASALGRQLFTGPSARLLETCLPFLSICQFVTCLSICWAAGPADSASGRFPRSVDLYVCLLGMYVRRNERQYVVAKILFRGILRPLRQHVAAGERAIYGLFLFLVRAIAALLIRHCGG